MAAFFRTTAVGQILRLSGNKIFAQKEQDDRKLLDYYLTTSGNLSTSEYKREPDEEVSEGERFHLIDWMPNDPERPANWSHGKRAFVTMQICVLTTAIYLSAAIYTAGITGVEEQFNVSGAKATLGLTLFVLGYGLGPMVWAPMSEMPYLGRNPVYLGTLAVFVALQPAVIYAKNFQTLLAVRFLSGLFGSPVLATGGASIVDMYEPSKRAYAISIWGIAAIMGPVMGPMVGGFAIDAKGWTWTIWEILWLSAFCFVFLFFFLPETSASHIIFARTCRLRKIIGGQSPSIRCQPELEGESLTPREILLMLFIRPFTLSFFEPIVLALNLYIALLYALIYLWFESFPIVFEGIYGFTGGEMGLAYVGILIGCLLAVPPFWWYLRRVTEPRFISGRLKPENRLPPACVGGFFIPISLFWFGWSSRASVHWIVPIIGTTFFTPGAFLLFNSVLNYLGDAYPRHAASVFAGNDLMRSSFGAGFPLFATSMFSRLGVNWASTLLAFLSIIFIPVPFVLVRYGERLRAASRHARHDL